MLELLASGGVRRSGLGRAPSGVHTPPSKRWWGWMLSAMFGLGCNSTDLCAKGLCEPQKKKATDSRDMESRGSSESSGEGLSSRSLSTSVKTRETTETSSARDESTPDITTEAACDPVSERGCGARTPWCLGIGADGGATSAESPFEPRCVECEEDAHCNFPFVERGEAAVCVGYRCVACDLTNDRGCTDGAPYCVAGRGETLGDASIEASEVTCEGCSNDDGGASIGAGPRCVECEVDTHCTSLKASRCDLATNTCVACDGIGQCSHMSATPACDVARGTCVECTVEESDACNGRLCNVAMGSVKYHTCSEFEEASTGQCGECVSDEQCLVGHKCVIERLPFLLGMPTGKRYCMREMSQNGEGCFDYPPFIASFETASLDGVMGRYCQLRTTTCATYVLHRKGPDIVPEGMPGAGAPTCFSDESCGLPGLGSGYCVEYTENVNRCTYSCTDDSDCPKQPLPVACEAGRCSVANWRNLPRTDTD